MAAAGKLKRVTWHFDLKVLPRLTKKSSSSSPEISMDSPLTEEEKSPPHGRDSPEVGNSATWEGNKHGVVSGEPVDTLISKLNVLWAKPPDSTSQEKESHGEDGGEERSGSDPRRGPRTVSEVEGDQGVDQNNDGQSQVGETSQIEETHPGLLASIGNSPLTMKRKWHGEEHPAGSSPLQKIRAVSVVEGDQVGDQNYGAQSELTASGVGWNSHMDSIHSGSLALMNDPPPKVYKCNVGSDYEHGVGSEFDETSWKWKEFAMVPSDQGGNPNNGAQSALTASELGEGSSHLDDAHSGLIQSMDNSPPMKRKWHEEESNRIAGSDPRRRPRTAFVVDEGDQGGQSELTASEVGGNSHIDSTHSGSPVLINHSPPRVYNTGIDYTVGVGSGFDEASGKWIQDIMQPDQGRNQNNGARTMEPNQRSRSRTGSFSSTGREKKIRKTKKTSQPILLNRHRNW